MRSSTRYFSAFCLALSLAACSDGGTSGAGTGAATGAASNTASGAALNTASGAASLAEGESAFSLRLSGGEPELGRVLDFEGKTNAVSLSVSETDIRLLVPTPIGIESRPEGYSLGLMTMRIDRAVPGEYGTDQFAINLVVQGFSNERGTTAYSLRERDGMGTLTVVSVSADRLRIRFAFDASPTQRASTGLVFRLEGEIEVRK